MVRQIQAEIVERNDLVVLDKLNGLVADWLTMVMSSKNEYTCIMPPPKVFISYSHDSQLHKDWILGLATRLVKNGVEVILDQWDIALGGDLPRFMESGLTAADLSLIHI